MKLPARAGSDASDRFSPMTADCAEDEYICWFWSTTMMPFPPELFEDGNCAVRMFCACWDSEFEGPPKFEPATLYDTAPKKVGICVPKTTSPIIQASDDELVPFSKERAEDVEPGRRQAIRALPAPDLSFGRI